MISEMQMEDILGWTPRKPTFQVVLESVVTKHDTFYRFKIDKKKRFKLTLEVFRDTFQIFPRIPGRDFDALSPEEDTVSFLRELDHTGEINSLNDVVVDQLHQPWRTFDALINWSLSGKTSGLEKLRLSRAQILWDLMEQFLPECLTSPAMKESKAYKTYLGYAIGAVPPKIARKFKKASPSKKDRPAKKSTNKPTAGVVIREAPVETKSKSKEKEMVEVTRGKGIELLSEEALTEELR
ncbi:hypothetical protein Tco_0355850 [Tanacetum coccineum]